jgi:hypothetical protein
MKRTQRLPRKHKPLRRTALVAALALSAALLIAPVAGGRASSHVRAHSSASYATGIGDENGQMFREGNYQNLHTKIVRYIAPYDASVHRDNLNTATAWIQLAEARHQQVLVAFYHSQHSPTRLPSTSQYQKDVAKFIKRFPYVRQYQAWDEANRGNVPHLFTSPSPAANARYYQALLKVCSGCTVIGLDVLDQSNTSPTLRYISEFKSSVNRLHARMPSIWGLHNYSDVNRYESWRTHQLVSALGGQVWVTETGGIVQFGGAFPNKHGSGLKRAAKVLKYMFSAAPGWHVARLYIYDWKGGVNSTRFDAGLTDPHYKARPGYVVVCKALHGAHCNVKTSNR